ncbi:MAG: deoxynucleoside kinase, partial [Paucimonas sp.]|nr:deoxynucleoside kinase [Paucimonas sp.]
YIVVEGPIGAGKTSLSKKIAESMGAQALLEMPQENPFLEKFYKDAARYALPTQMFFLFQRINQLRDVAQTDMFSARIVSDFLLEKDPLFARLNLSDDELNLYRQLYDQLRPQAAQPDLVIYLQAQPETLLERIKKRGLAMEHGISEIYLFRLCEAYARFFYHYETSPLLIVNTEHLNPANEAEDFDLLMQRIRTMRGKREFFNRGE